MFIDSTNERPYQCKKCDSKFRRKDALNTHMRSHEQKTRRRRLDDDDDDWSSTQSSNDDEDALPMKPQNTTLPIVGSDGYTNFSYKISM